MNRRDLDAIFPIVVRYTGCALVVVLVGATITGHGLDLAAGYVAASGMILYKSVRDAAAKDDDDDDDDDEEGSERWSHLP